MPKLLFCHALWLDRTGQGPTTGMFTMPGTSSVRQMLKSMGAVSNPPAHCSCPWPLFSAAAAQMLHESLELPIIMRGCGARTRRSRKAARMSATGAPPPRPSASAASAACCAMLDAPEVVWLWTEAAARAKGCGAAR